jgi:hypothetical protein
MNSPAPSRRQGAALIITLFFLVIISVIAFAFLDAARVDRSTSNSHFERTRATNLARSGIEAVVGTLQREAGDPPQTTNSNYFPRNWISQPGALTVTDGSDKTKLVKSVPLSSGEPSATGLDWTLQPPDLNVQLLTDPAAHLLTDKVTMVDDPQNPGKKKPQSVVMKVRWIYVRQDGTVDLDVKGLPVEKPVLTDLTNPIVGRYAYWADDESSKINYNLAWRNDLNEPGAQNPNPIGNPTRVDLRALRDKNNQLVPDLIANSIHGYITADAAGKPANYQPGTMKRFFNSPFDARQIENLTTREVMAANKFALTHYNSDPDTTYYGRPRMMLTTQQSNAEIQDVNRPVGVPPVIRPFLDILATPNTDPGRTAGISGPKLNAVVNDLINNYLKRTDWPMVDGAHSIQEKYYKSYSGADRDARLAQVALNIIDYVRSVESSRPIVQPIRAKWLNGVFTGEFTDSSIVGTADTFKGLVRSPYITEMGMWVSDTPEAVGVNVGRYRTLGLVEVFLPANYGIDKMSLLKDTDGQVWNVYFGEFGSSTAKYYKLDGSLAGAGDYRVLNPRAPGTTPAFVYEARTENAAIVASAASKTVMTPGTYRTIAIELYRDKSKAQARTVTLRAAITLGEGKRIDVTPLTGSPGLNIDLKDNVGELGGSSYETNDPRVNGLAADWSRAVLCSFGKQNAAWNVGQLPKIDPVTTVDTPPQDVDAKGNLSMASFRMPSPKDLAKPDTTGLVRSAGELGFIHTGIEGSATAGAVGVPWRSLRLQPSNQPTTVVPDWAFIDLFTVPSVVPAAAAAIFSPHGNSAGGRVNVNAKPEPASFDIARTESLAAAFRGVRKSRLTSATLTANEAQVLAQRIYDHAPSPRLPFPAPPRPAGKAYPAGGSLVYESPGEIAEIEGIADGGEESEILLSEVINLLTTRGNVFGVYTVGQALKQTPAGKLVITAEQRQQAMVERYIWTKNTTVGTDDEVRFRTVYFRNLSP